MLPYIDTVLHDLKLMDEERHKKWTGVSNKRLLENFKKAYETLSRQDLHRPPAADSRRDDDEEVSGRRWHSFARTRT